MKQLIQIIVFIIFSLLLFSCSFFSSQSFTEHIYNINYLTANFIVLKQDTTSFPNGDFFNYCILQDSLGRKYCVLEDGCSNQGNDRKKVSLNDTIVIEIKLTDPKRLHREDRKDNFRGPNGNPVFVIDNEVMQIFQSDKLCNHHLYLNN